MDRPHNLYSPITYNLVAKRIREMYAKGGDNPVNYSIVVGIARVVLSDLAIEFARAFKRDRPDFDHLKFLDQCSPDPDVYPISELWED